MRVIAIAWDAPEQEAVITALTAVAPRLEVTAPGLCIVPAQGPTRFYGSEAAACTQLRNAVVSLVDVQVGVADSRFAAALAAQRNRCVAPGKTREFLSRFPVSVLDPLMDDKSEFSDLLQRLGLHTLGAFAELPVDAVMARFGRHVAHAHRLARGEQPTPLILHVLADPPTLTTELDPPAERVDIAAFAGRALAADFIEHLTKRGLACTRLRIDAETEHGEELTRLWRAITVFDAETIVERLRWQLDGWLSDASPTRPTSGITLLRLHADEVAGSGDLQLGLWGEMSAVDRRAARGLDRIRGLLGPDSVLTALVRGGRSPAEQVQFVPWGEPTPPPNKSDSSPWPGCLPSPAPALVYPTPLPAVVTGPSGTPVHCSGRGLLDSPIATLRICQGPTNTVDTWAGPWLSDERWWDRRAHRRRARFQLVTTDHAAYLCVVEQGEWWIEATYD